VRRTSPCVYAHCIIGPKDQPSSSTASSTPLLTSQIALPETDPEDEENEEDQDQDVVVQESEQDSDLETLSSSRQPSRRIDTRSSSRGRPVDYAPRKKAAKKSVMAPRLRHSLRNERSASNSSARKRKRTPLECENSEVD
jgi:hypothetical protein